MPSRQCWGQPLLLALSEQAPPPTPHAEKTLAISPPTAEASSWATAMTLHANGSTRAISSSAHSAGAMLASRGGNAIYISTSGSELSALAPDPSVTSNAGGCTTPAGAFSQDGSSATGCGTEFTGASAASPSVPPCSPPTECRPRSEVAAAARGPSAAPPPGYLPCLWCCRKGPRAVITPLAEDRRQ
jgi:hypothetical protein